MSVAACSIHAIMRAGERYKVPLDERDFDRIVMLIERDGPRAVPLYPRPQRNGYRSYAVLHRGTFFALVFNPMTQQIVTVLPPRVLDPYRERLERLRAEIETPTH